jgi:hypothetical protein
MSCLRFGTKYCSAESSRWPRHLHSSQSSRAGINRLVLLPRVDRVRRRWSRPPALDLSRDAHPSFSALGHLTCYDGAASTCHTTSDGLDMHWHGSAPAVSLVPMIDTEPVTMHARTLCALLWPELAQAFATGTGSKSPFRTLTTWLKPKARDASKGQ